MELMMSEHDRTIPVEPLPEEIESWLVGHTVGEIEQILILHTLAHNEWNRAQSANRLGISLRTMSNKLRAYQNETGRASDRISLAPNRSDA
jgi:DNA-binding NtrC family response regulator